MNQWSADIVNDLSDDGNLVMEILHNGNYVAVIKRNNHSLQMTWYPSNEIRTIPVDWLMELFEEVASWT